MKRKYQEGGDWRTGMMKSRMATAAALGNPSAIRMTQLYPMTYNFTGKEGTDVPAGATGTHYMSSMGEYAVPYIQEKNGKLIFNKKASFRDKEAMRFNSPEEAEYFAEHYKEVAPMMREYAMGGFSTEGYKLNSPDRHNPFNIIPSGRITMKDVPHPVMGMDNMGNKQMMMPGGEYQFPGNSVYELPIKNNDMKKRMQQGGRPSKFEYIHEDRNGNKFTVHRGNEPISQQQFDHLVDVSRAYPYNPQATGSFMPSHPIHAIRPGDEPMEMNGGVPPIGAMPMAALQPMQKKNGGYSGTYSNGVYFKNGGPTYMPGGSAPVFANGGNTASFYVDGNGYPVPFAMNPGSGRGGGMLQDLPTHMQMGGIPGAQQVHPFAMNPGPGTGTGMLQEYAAETMRMGGKPCLECGGMAKYGGMPDFDGDVDMMKKGGHWIQGAVNPAHKGYCTPMTKSTCTPRRKAFAMTMKKHHGFHEYGGNVTQGGNMVADNEMYAEGGYANPFHPLARFMQNGGREPVSPDSPMGGGMNLPADPNQPNPWQATPSNYDPSTDPNNPVNKPENQPIYNADDSQNSPEPQEPGDTSGEDYSEGKQRRGVGWGIAGAGLAAMGAGLGIASYFANQRDARNLRNKQFNDRMSSNAFAAQNGPGGKGDWDQYGNFRPNQNTPAKPGMFYPQQTGKYGGNFAHGGMYQPGQEVEMSDAEIARLRKMGYKIDIL